MLTTNNLSTLTGTLKPHHPFDFARTLAFLHEFSPTAGEQALAIDSVTKAVTVNKRAIAFELRNAGTVEEPQLAYTLFSEPPLSDAEHATVAARIRFFSQSF